MKTDNLIPNFKYEKHTALKLVSIAERLLAGLGVDIEPSLKEEVSATKSVRDLTQLIEQALINVDSASCFI